MGNRPLAVIHCEPKVSWQGPAAQRFQAGFNRLGIPSIVVSDRMRRDEGFPVLLGTTFWGHLERDGGRYLLVDRCQYGDTNKWVSLGWNGRGREADYRARFDASRWERYGMPLKPWRSVSRWLLCGQLPAPTRFYEEWSGRCVGFRPHPAGDNPTSLPAMRDASDAGFVVHSSTVANWAVIEGIPTITANARAMAWDVTGHSPGEVWDGDRLPWCHWLAWCQWNWDEIAEGIPHLWD